MMEYAEIRWRFRDSVGDDRYQRFVAAIHHTSRLRFWQEQIWGPFASNHSLELDLAAIKQCFAVCHVHDCCLELDTVEVVYGTPITSTEAEIKVVQVLFPQAGLSVGGGCCVGEQKSAEILFCPDCRRAYKQWESQAFKRNIASPDSKEIQLYISAKASRFVAENRLLRYYRSWKPPRASSDLVLAGYVKTVTDIYACLASDGPSAKLRHLLASASAMFEFTAANDEDAAILDHCKMHYIAANAILRIDSKDEP